MIKINQGLWLNNHKGKKIEVNRNGKKVIIQDGHLIKGDVVKLSDSLEKKIANMIFGDKTVADIIEVEEAAEETEAEEATEVTEEANTENEVAEEITNNEVEEVAEETEAEEATEVTEKKKTTKRKK